MIKITKDKSKLALSCKMTAILSLALCGLTACNGDGGSTTNSSSSSTSKATIANTQSNSFYAMKIGSGYDHSSHTTTSDQSCLVNASNQDNITIGNYSAISEINGAINLSKMEQALNVDVTSALGGNRFDGSVASEFANSSKDTLYTTNLLYLYDYAGRASFKANALGYGVDALTPEAASLAQTSPTEFRSLCGDKFIAEMDAGLVIGVRLSLHFNSHADQNEFMQTINGMGGNPSLANAAEIIKQTEEKTGIYIPATLSAIQLGGEPEKLNAVFGAAYESGSYPSMACNSVESPEGIGACEDVASDILSYSQDIGDQVFNVDGSSNINALHYSVPVVSPYSDLAIIAPVAANPSQEVSEAVKQLINEYDQAVYNRDFADHYVSVLSDKMDSKTQDNLKDSSQKLDKQIKNVFLNSSYDILNCYKGYVSDQCLSTRDNIESGLANDALSQDESELLTYLEFNAYLTPLVNYYGDETPESSDYKVSNSDCVLAPVSSASLGMYAVSCDGKWLATKESGGVTILSTYDDTVLDVKNLSYFSISPTSGIGQLITYSDSVLLQGISSKNYFYTNQAKVSASQFETVTEFGLVRSYDNPA